MAEAKLSSGLFAGTHFDRKKFAADFARFQKGPPPTTAAAAALSASSSEKKRKRRSKAKAKKNNKKGAEAAADSSGEARHGWLLLGL
jgi:ATP-dependent RNA helicase DDX52/ROK1